jgi:hypothetical protein
MNKNEIIVDGITYVKLEELKTDMADRDKDTEKYSDYSIVRTYSAGVFCGEIIKKEGQEVCLKNARRLWYWDGAASLSQLSIDGVGRPQNCKFPAEVAEVILLQVIEILPCTVKAVKSIKEVPVWKE